jgi:hypothetical protein
MGFLADIKAEINSLAPGRRDLRNLGLIFLVALGLIGAFLLWTHRPAGWYLLGLAAVFGLWGLTWPAGLRPVHRAWMTLAVALGFIVSRVLLSLIFYLVVTPVGLVLRLLGKDVLDMKLKDRPSYWRYRDEAYDPKRTEKMY